MITPFCRRVVVGNLPKCRGAPSLDHVSAFPEIALRVDAVARLDSVTVRRGDATLLREVSWTVRGNERWVVLGANGAGKTTLLQVAAGTIRPDAGAVELLGEDLTEADLDDLLPRVGWGRAGLAARPPTPERG